MLVVSGLVAFARLGLVLVIIGRGLVLMFVVLLARMITIVVALVVTIVMALVMIVGHGEAKSKEEMEDWGGWWSFEGETVIDAMLLGDDGARPGGETDLLRRTRTPPYRNEFWLDRHENKERALMIHQLGNVVTYLRRGERWSPRWRVRERHLQADALSSLSPSTISASLS